MKLTFIGATHEVTGSCSLLEACGKHILIDCGMEQGRDMFANIDIPVNPGELDAIVVTHAHIDHSGKIPFLVANGYNNPIYATLGTTRLCNIMLLDSAHIQEQEAEWHNRKAKRSGAENYEPLYTSDDAMATIQLFQPLNYGEAREILPGIEISFSDAGHLMGSSSILFKINEDGKAKSILFSGDVGNLGKPLIKDYDKPPHADYLVCESTYGDRVHPQKPDYVKELSQIIQSTLDKGGNLVIPSFAVGRTQELLYFIRIIKQDNLIKGHPNFPVYLDSPLAVEATNIYSKDMEAFYDEEAKALVDQGINPISFSDLIIATSTDQSKAINDNDTPKIIISASGMCEAGRIRHHLKHNLWRPESTILFVGYQSPSTVGGKLISGADSIKLFGEEIQVQAEIAQVDSFSSHADKNMLLDYIKACAPQDKLFINHGEDEVVVSFAKEASEAVSVPAECPYSGDSYDLLTGECIEQNKPVPIIHKESTHSSQGDHRESKNNPDYDKLRSSSQDLSKLIGQMNGYSNKELRALNDEIQALLKKHQSGQGQS